MPNLQEKQFLKLLKFHAQTLKNSLSGVKGKMAIPGDMDLKTLVDEFAEEFSSKTPGIFPGQISPNRLIDYHNRFTEYMPGYADRNPARVGSEYSKEVTQLTWQLSRNVLQDLKNNNVQISWWMELLGRLFVKQGTVRNELTRFVEQKTAGMAEALR